jgi:hypothetical protein
LEIRNTKKEKIKQTSKKCEAIMLNNENKERD